MDPVIELDGLEVRFGDRAILKGLKARLTGRAIGLLGPNGADKSTLLNTLLGFHKPANDTARMRPPLFADSGEASTGQRIIGETSAPALRNKGEANGK